MKTILRSFAVLAMIAAFTKVQAQCTVSAPVISNIQKNGCTFTFDLNFNLQNNNGNKVTAVYIFNTADYNALPANFFGQNNNSVPNSASINNGKALATIKIDTDSAKTVYNYQKVANGFQRPASMQSNLDYVVDPSGQITIKNISVTFTDCSMPIGLKADVLSSQSPELSSVGCIAKGLTFSPNEPIITALDRGCGGTRSVAATFITVQPRNVDFRIFVDVAPFNQFTAADTAAANALSPVYSLTTALNNSTNDYRSTGNFTYTPPASVQFNLWLVAYTNGIANVSTAVTSNQCAPSILPTTFASMAAERDKQHVVVKWRTATEENNRGFNVQRSTGNGEWKSLEFVPTMAANGTSSNVLSYAFVDYYAPKGTVQYRVQQVGQDGKIAYSAIRSVRSEEATARVSIYPNPSSDGKINIMFDASSVRNIIVNDISGRVVKQLTGVKENNVVIDNLTTGFYTLQIIDQVTSAVSLEKVIVKSR
jgi:hypothetical protein